MSNGDLFYICGIILAVSAVVVTFLGLRMEKFPGRLAPIVVLWFVVFVGGSAGFSVLHSQDEEKHHEQEVGLPHATEEAEEEAAEVEEAGE
jgi:hypothetical protein